MPNDWRIVLMLYSEDILIENIMKKGNKVLIWGACERNNDILEFFRQNDVNVVGYIDQNADEQNTCNDLPVYNKDIIRSDSYFVYVGLLKTYDEVISHLESNNYREFADYWYPNREIKLDGSCDYKDLYGNEYIGEKYSIDITLKNCGKLYIGENCEFNDVQILVFEMSEIKIGNNVKIKAKSRIRSRTKCDLYLGNKFSSENHMEIDLYYHSRICINDNFIIKHFGADLGFVRFLAEFFSKITIDENVSVGDNLQIVAVQNSQINIGKDCMLSKDITIRAGNSHNIYDIDKHENISKKGRNVIIGDHVWIGYRAILFNGCKIDSGSVVGINTFINKKFPANCSIAGNPATIIKKNISWRRESYPYFNSYDDFEEFDFR